MATSQEIMDELHAQRKENKASFSEVHVSFGGVHRRLDEAKAEAHRFQIEQVRINGEFLGHMKAEERCNPNTARRGSLNGIPWKWVALGLIGIGIIAVGVAWSIMQISDYFGT